MAGDWIKMELATPEKPEVMAIAAAMGWDDPDLAVGKLFKLWRWFDQHTETGNAASVTPALLNRIIGVTGFAEACESVGWLEATDDGLSLPNFDRHNGNTAKRRCQTAKRASALRGRDKSNAASVTKCAPREEKRREEKEGRQAEPPPCQPTDSEDGQRQRAIGTVGRMLGRELSIAHMQALDTWATSIPPTIGLDGRDVPRWELIDLAASSAIRAGASPRSIGGATKYIARVIESCIRDERLPDERAGPPIDRPRDGSIPFNPKPVKSGLRTDA